MSLYALSDLSNVTSPHDHMTVTAVWYISFVSFSFHLSVYLFFTCVVYAVVATLSLSICKLSMCAFPGVENANEPSALIWFHRQFSDFSNFRILKNIFMQLKNIFDMDLKKGIYSPDV